MSEENVEQTPESNEPVGIGKGLQRIGFVIAAVLLLAASPFVYAFVMFSAEGIGNSMANKAASEISPEVQKLLPLNKAFLDEATSKESTALLGNVGEWFSNISWGTEVLGCPSPYLQENNSADSCMINDSDVKKPQTPEQMCKNFIEYGKKLGATNEISVLFAKGQPISKSSVTNCMKTTNSQLRSASWALFSPDYILYGEFKPGTPMAVGISHELLTPQAAVGGVNGPTLAPYSGKAILQPLVDRYSITVATTFDQKTIQVAPSAFADGKNRTAALLDLIAFYRAANQQQDPRSKVFVDAVIKDFNARYEFPGTWKSFVTADNKVHWVQVTRDDGYQICIAIERKNSTNKNINEQPSENDTGGNGDFVGNGDITWGMPGAQGMELQGIGKEIKSMDADYYFGDYIVGKCTNPTS